MACLSHIKIFVNVYKYYILVVLNSKLLEKDIEYYNYFEKHKRLVKHMMNEILFLNYIGDERILSIDGLSPPP
jgi:hypothetical protein